MEEYRISGFAGVKDEKGRLFFGGSQDWYGEKWKRMAGCASVAAANLAAFYGLDRSADTPGPDRHLEKGYRPGKKEELVIYTKNEYLSLMERMFALMRPGLLGFPFFRRFRRRFIAYAARNGVYLEGKSLARWKDISQPLAFITEALAANDPVVMLILRHKSPELKHQTWHWMTITGCSSEDRTLRISNYGNEEQIDAAVLFEPSFSNWVKLLSFHPEGKEQK